MPFKAIILCPKKLDIEDINLQKILNVFGIEYEILFPESVINSHLLWNRNITPSDWCLLTSGKTFATLTELFLRGKDELSHLLSNFSNMLVYSINPVSISSKQLQRLTDNQISSIFGFQHDHYQYKVSEEYQDICGPFSGLKTAPIQSEIDFALNIPPHSNQINNLISIDDKGFFVKTKINNCNLFLIACKRVLNIDHKVSVNFEASKHFSQIIPVIMFLKYAFRDACWNSSKKYASLIIDDPLLRPEYGFLNYKKLLELMDEHHFSTNIAFIPWNYKRTSKSISKMFLHRSDKFNICIHGCDHTRFEFGSSDSARLNSYAKLAKSRMQIHQKITGIKHNNVMVFPQGIFSIQAMKILKYNNFLAAVNSEVIPNFYNNNIDKIEISQFLEPAIMKYETFALFTRRKPSDEIVNFAFDLLIGKPLLIGIHHDYFKQGYKQLIRFIRKINLLDKDLCWDGLENIVGNVYFKRIDSNGNINVKMYANNLLIENLTDETKTYIVAKKETDHININSVILNGKKIPFHHIHQSLEFSFKFESKQKAIVKILYENNYPEMDKRMELSYQIKTAARRYLSEFRDNFLMKNNTAIKMAFKIKVYSLKELLKIILQYKDNYL